MQKLVFLQWNQYLRGVYELFFCGALLKGTISSARCAVHVLLLCLLHIAISTYFCYIHLPFV